MSIELHYWYYFSAFTFLAILCQLLFHGTQGKTIKPMNLSPKIAQWLVLSKDEILIATLVVFLFFVAFFPYMAWIDELGYWLLWTLLQLCGYGLECSKIKTDKKYVLRVMPCSLQ